MNLSQILKSNRAVFNCLNLARNTHSPQTMTEYRGQGLFLNLKLDPSPICPKEHKRNKLITHCTWIVQKDSLHFSFVSFTEKRKEPNNCPFISIYCVLVAHCSKNHNTLHTQSVCAASYIEQSDNTFLHSQHILLWTALAKFYYWLLQVLTSLEEGESCLNMDPEWSLKIVMPGTWLIKFLMTRSHYQSTIYQLYC